MACCISRGVSFSSFSQGRRSQKMTTNPKAEEHSQGTDNEQEPKPVAVGWLQKIEDQYKKKKDVETFPYMWASYILVYGGFGMWLAYRLRALRKMEDRVRAHQDKLRKQYEASNSAEVAAKPVKYGSSTSKPPSADKVDR